MSVARRLTAVVVFVFAGCAGPPPEPDVQTATHEEILAAVADNEARLTIVNMWATWCAPCIEEFPYFMAVAEQFAGQGVEMVFVSADFEDERPGVEAFLKDQGWTRTSYHKTGPDEAFVNGFDTRWSGALPATFLYGPGGTQLTFWEGETSQEELTARVEEILDGP